MVCIDNRVDVKITATGAQSAAYTLTEEKIYYNKGLRVKKCVRNRGFSRIDL